MENDKRYNRQFMTIQQTCPHSCVEIVFYSLTRWSNLDSRHMKCGLLAQQRRRKYAESLPHILQPRSGPSSQRLADFLRHLAPSSGDCAVNSDSIRATLVSAEGSWDRLKLSNRAPLGVMLRHCHRACMQNSLGCGSLVRLG